jgi:hypothetical protein
MPQATLIFEDREVLDDGPIVQMRIWQVPRPVPPSRHRFKYALFFGYPGERIVLFGNERGKGDHKHIREVETSYAFLGPEQLIADFIAAIEAIRKDNT